MSEVLKFFDNHVAHHGALRSESGDLRPLLHKGVLKKRIKVAELEELGEHVKKAIEHRKVVTPRMQYGINTALGHLKSENYENAMHELRSAFFWSTPANLRALESHFSDNGMRLKLGPEFLASTAHVLSGDFQGRPAVVKIEPVNRILGNGALLAEQLPHLPLSKVLYSGKTPFVPARVTVSTKLDGKLAVQQIAATPNLVTTVYRSMGGALAKLHASRISKPIADAVTERPRTWSSISSDAEKIAPSVAKNLEFTRDVAGKLQACLSRKVGESKPTLIHNDFHEENVLVDSKGEVSGILDYSTPRLGDPLYDLAKALYYAKRTELLYNFKGSASALEAGYKRAKNLTTEEQKRLNYFAVAVAVRFAPSYTSDPEQKAAAKRILLEAIQKATS